MSFPCCSAKWFLLFHNQVCPFGGRDIDVFAAEICKIRDALVVLHQEQYHHLSQMNSSNNRKKKKRGGNLDLL